jgi:hypothetical protein
MQELISGKLLQHVGAGCVSTACVAAGWRVGSIGCIVWIGWAGELPWEYDNFHYVDDLFVLVYGI